MVITGMGIISPIGNSVAEVKDSLWHGKSGIEFNSEYEEFGLRSQVCGSIDADVSGIDRKVKRFMGTGAMWNYLAMQQAIADSGLADNEVSNDRVGLIMGSGGASTDHMMVLADTVREQGIKRLGPYFVPKVMSSTNSATLATPFKIRGVNYTITSACATSTHCIGNAYELISMGRQDRVFAGGGENLHWTLTSSFDAMGALSSGSNANPEKASRPFDRDRDGFVIAGGAGVVVLESLDVALARGANILAEVVGYAATSDGYDMVAPSGEGAARCMQQTIASVDGNIDYINAHGTSTKVGDAAELGAIAKVFGDNIPLISSTKSQTGHSLGAAGVHEMIYTLIMLRDGFIAPTINLDNVDPELAQYPLVAERVEKELTRVLTNNFGFGGTNASIALAKYLG